MWLIAQRLPPSQEDLRGSCGTLRHAAELCTRLLRLADGVGPLELHAAAGDLAAGLGIASRPPFLRHAVQPMRAACSALAALLQASTAARRQLAGGAGGWAAIAADIRQVSLPAVCPGPL